ncbi:MAG: TlyA family RNA methyltransferase [Candidatus Paceibacterota bacterium]|jgi:23S rRNA (cytidine1920-2'-O)/16S rRNA (cytidine1409-2'-O)-methyltransferase
MKKRLDILLFELGLVDSRKKASDLIKEGKVIVDSVVINKPSKEFVGNEKIEITEVLKYVSRAGLKLEGAHKEFNFDIKDKVAVDVGSSTGGFTDFLLQNGAKRVYAIDVGTGQLVEKLRNNNKVISLEKTDIRKAELSEKVDLAVVDVSFISLELVLPSIIKLLKEGGEVIVLVKPQFEVGKENIGKGGIVKDEKAKKLVLEKIKRFSEDLGLRLKGEITSPIKGGDGNEEYFFIYKN